MAVSVTVAVTVAVAVAVSVTASVAVAVVVSVTVEAGAPEDDSFAGVDESLLLPAITAPGFSGVSCAVVVGPGS